VKEKLEVSDIVASKIMHQKTASKRIR